MAHQQCVNISKIWRKSRHGTLINFKWEVALGWTPQNQNHGWNEKRRLVVEVMATRYWVLAWKRAFVPRLVVARWPCRSTFLITISLAGWKTVTSAQVFITRERACTKRKKEVTASVATIWVTRNMLTQKMAHPKPANSSHSRHKKKKKRNIICIHVSESRWLFRICDIW